jgi:uncharacterized protein YcnI
MKRMTVRAAVAAAILFATPTAVLAHATLEVGEAHLGSTYKAVLRVPHGCEGSPTLKVRVQIPEGVIGVKPMPKAGWTLETVKGDYAGSYTMWGEPVTSGVKEITWTGRLLDEHYDEFVFRAYLSEQLPANSMLYFPTVQECEHGVERWIEIPAEGKSEDDYEFPAPGLKLLPK